MGAITPIILSGVTGDNFVKTFGANGKVYNDATSPISVLDINGSGWLISIFPLVVVSPGKLFNLELDSIMYPGSGKYFQVQSSNYRLSYCFFARFENSLKVNVISAGDLPGIAYILD
jgi:hypothetical protein